jgi:hypothetical protein
VEERLPTIRDPKDALRYMTPDKILELGPKEIDAMGIRQPDEVSGLGPQSQKALALRLYRHRNGL